MNLIGLSGPAGAGKDTVAEYLLAEHNFQRVSFFCVIFRLIDALRAPGIVFAHVCCNEEAELVRGMGGQVWHLQRPGLERVRLRRDAPGVLPAGPDRGLLNDGTIAHLHQRVDHLIVDMFGR